MVQNTKCIKYKIPLKSLNASPIQPPPWNPPPDFVLRTPNPLLKVIKQPCVRYHMVKSHSANEPSYEEELLLKGRQRLDNNFANYQFGFPCLYADSRIPMIRFTYVGLMAFLLTVFFFEF